MRYLLALLLLTPARADDSVTFTVRVTATLVEPPVVGALHTGDGWASVGTFHPRGSDEQIPCALFFSQDGTFLDADCDI